MEYCGYLKYLKVLSYFELICFPILFDKKQGFCQIYLKVHLAGWTIWTELGWHWLETKRKRFTTLMGNIIHIYICPLKIRLVTAHGVLLPNDCPCIQLVTTCPCKLVGLKRRQLRITPKVGHIIWILMIFDSVCLEISRKVRWRSRAEYTTLLILERIARFSEGSPEGKP